MSKNKKVFLYLTSTIVTAAFANFAAISCNQQDNTKPELPANPQNPAQTKTEFEAPKATVSFSSASDNSAVATIDFSDKFILKSEWNKELAKDKQVFNAETEVEAVLVLRDTEQKGENTKYSTFSAKVLKVEKDNKKPRTTVSFSLKNLEANTKYFFNLLQVDDVVYKEGTQLSNTDKTTLSFTTKQETPVVNTTWKAPKATVSFNATAWNTATATVDLESPFILKSEWNSELEENKQVFSTENTVDALLILSNTETNTDSSKYITVSAKLSNTDAQDKKARTHLTFDIDKLQATAKYYFNSLQINGETYLFNEVAEKSMIKNTDKSTLSFTTLTKSGEEAKPEISSWEAPKATVTFDGMTENSVMAHVVLDSPFILRREWDKTKEKKAQEIAQANTVNLKMTLVTSLDENEKKQYITTSTTLSNSAAAEGEKPRTKADFSISGLQPGTTYYLKSFEISSASYTFDKSDEDSLIKNDTQPQFSTTGTKVKENISEWSAPKVNKIEFNDNKEALSGVLKIHLESPFILQKEWDKTIAKENQTFNPENSQITVNLVAVALESENGAETNTILNVSGQITNADQNGDKARTLITATFTNLMENKWYKLKSLQIDSTNYNFSDTSEQKLYTDTVSGQTKFIIIKNVDGDISIGDEEDEE
ncbi:hypothetical protein [Mycoplasma procyoni]|uniref:hypothetical protein n=1 Tax=Mycoplasma procyoni TaxID=568784 RepID=UPI00197B70C0|nr:hypothetical protein [Mycoplasma procyoni]MBN3534525.1 hypothetical protein [Mycoplasma procyoni]